MDSIIMLSATILLLFVISHDTEANISLGSCSLSCNENEDHAHDLIGTGTGLQGPPGKRGNVGQKGENGIKGDVGVKGESGSKGIPGESCNCSRYDELATQMARLREKVVLLEERSRQGPAGWITASNNHFYKFFDHETVNYETAKSRCASYNARLAAEGLRTTELRTEIKRLLPDSIPDTWIGLDELASQGNFVWSDGVSSTRSNTDWKSGQPNDSAERCGALNSKGVWDRKCMLRYNYLCEF